MDAEREEDQETKGMKTKRTRKGQKRFKKEIMTDLYQSKRRREENTKTKKTNNQRKEWARNSRRAVITCNCGRIATCAARSLSAAAGATVQLALTTVANAL
jgi:hypothetical protein